MWTYSIEYDDGRTGKRVSTMVEGWTAAQALEELAKVNPEADVVELRRIRHD